MDPSINMFEDELCRLINKDQIERKKMLHPNGTNPIQEVNHRVSVVERRLRVNQSCRLCYRSSLHVSNEILFMFRSVFTMDIVMYKIHLFCI
jgi:hypothetical protein